ncbi:MAG: hypothetical protein KDE26_18895 [Bacteroidetes bacterium]|nr:hypothetical protein [Bacteroidota bacterium]
MKPLVYYIFCILLAVPALLSAKVDLQALKAELNKEPKSPEKVTKLIDASKKSYEEYPQEAIKFADEALKLATELKDRNGIVNAHSHLGLLYVNKKSENFEEAQRNLIRAINLKNRLAREDSKYNPVSISKDYRLLAFIMESEKKQEKALEYYQRGVTYAVDGKDKMEQIHGFNSIGDILNQMNKHEGALLAFNRSLRLANELGLASQVREIENKRETTRTLLNNFIEKQEYVMELENIEEEIEFVKDSLTKEITKEQESKQILISEKELLENERAKKEAEIKAKEQQVKAQEQALLAQEAEKRNYIIGGAAGLILFLMIIIGLTSRIRAKKKANEAIQLEKQKSDDLLLNILPENVADELKESGKVMPSFHEEVSILFTDFKGFTSIATKLEPGHLIQKLETAFEAFDDIIDKYGLEKIKTIGDAYMAVANLTRNDPHHAINAVAAAMEMQEFMDQWIGRQKRKGEEIWELRIGIHSGPVVAGVIGQKKFAYDIWGDAVNVASRVESSGEAGKVNISADTYELVKSYCSFEDKRTVRVKNKGMVDMYFVTDITARRRPKPQTSPSKVRKKKRWF